MCRAQATRFSRKRARISVSDVSRRAHLDRQIAVHSGCRMGEVSQGSQVLGGGEGYPTKGSKRTVSRPLLRGLSMNPRTASYTRQPARVFEDAMAQVIYV